MYIFGGTSTQIVSTFNIIIMTSYGHTTTRRRLVPVFDFNEEGNLEYKETVDMNLYKECPNCYAIFVKDDNVHILRNAIGVIISKY